MQEAAVNIYDPATGPRAHDLSRMWILDRSLTHHGAWVEAKNLRRILDMARITGLVLSSYQLSDKGFVLKTLLEERQEEGNRMLWKVSFRGSVDGMIWQVS